MGTSPYTCCGDGCLIFVDYCDRTNNSDLGCFWDEISGDWEIKSNQLYAPGGNAMVICTKPNPLSERAVVHVNIYPTGGEKYRIVVNYKDDSNYQYVEAECTTESLILRAGSESRTYTTADAWDITNPSNDMQLSAWFDEGFLYVSVTHLGFYGCVWDNQATIIAGGYRVGLMNGGSVALYYAGFFFYQHYLDRSSCPDLGCYCHYSDDGEWKRHYVDWKLRLDYFSDDCPGECPDGCCCFENSAALLEYDLEFERWETVSGGLPDTPLPGGVDPDAPIIWCGADENCDWRMVQAICCDATGSPEGCDQTLGCFDVIANSLVCDPFAVRWDFWVPTTDLTCVICGGPGNPDGTYYAIATEL